MTLKEIKGINKEISRLRSKAIRLEGEAERVTQNLSAVPCSGSVSDKIGNLVSQIADIQKEINNLEILRNSALNRLSRDIFEENCLYMRLSLRYSWAKISVITGGINSPDNIRMKCERYFW